MVVYSIDFKQTEKKTFETKTVSVWLTQSPLKPFLGLTVEDGITKCEVYFRFYLQQFAPWYT